MTPGNQNSSNLDESAMQNSRDQQNVSGYVGNDLTKESNQQDASQMLEISELMGNEIVTKSHGSEGLYQRHYLVNRSDILTAAYQIRLTYYPSPEMRVPDEMAYRIAADEILSVFQTPGGPKCHRGANCANLAVVDDGHERTREMVYCFTENIWLCAEDCNRSHHKRQYKQ